MDIALRFHLLEPYLSEIMKKHSCGPVCVTVNEDPSLCSSPPGERAAKGGFSGERELFP
jgi:hypothetical protein